jgi:SAM-dependent methyltransferase
MTEGVALSRQADDGVRASYAAMPYRTQARKRTHPARLAALASLFGLDPTAPGKAKIVEVGCGTGENLAAIAAALPGAKCLGLDLVPEAIAQARQLSTAVGLGNLYFEVGDVRGLGAVDGAFDYVIAHGLFSWVTPETQGDLLRACRRAIAPNGLVYISYNTYPGWHLRTIVRDLMLDAASGADDEGERVRRGRQALYGVVDALAAVEAPYAALLSVQRDNVRQLSDGHVAHDLMEGSNNPLYFRTFVERARTAGLKYLGEAALEWMVADNYPAGVRDALGKEGDLFKRDQLLDFLINRTFRESVLCSDRLGPAMGPLPQRLPAMWVSGALKSEAPHVDLESPGRALFVGAGNVRVAIEGSLGKAAVICLAEAWPEAVTMVELIDRARTKLGRAAVAESEILDLTRLIYAAYSKGLFDLAADAPPVVRTPGERPTASRLARTQLAGGTIVSSLLVDNVAVDDELCRRLLPLLDGSRDRAALAGALSADAPAIEGALQRLAGVGLIGS